jgi:hypothetical protein
MGGWERQAVPAAITLALLAAGLAGAAPAAAGRAKRTTHRKPAPPAHVLAQSEIDAYLEAEEMKSRAAQRERDARAAVVTGRAGHVPEAGDLAPSLLTDSAPPAPAAGRVHRAVTRRPPGVPPPSVAGSPTP